MTPETDGALREVYEQRLLDRYVGTTNERDRSTFVGTHGSAGWQSIGAGWILGLWPRVKVIPVLGPTVHRIYTWLRRSGG